MMMLLFIFIFRLFLEADTVKFMQKLIIKNSTLNYSTIWNSQSPSDFKGKTIIYYFVVHWIPTAHCMYRNHNSNNNDYIGVTFFFFLLLFGLCVQCFNGMLLLAVAALKVASVPLISSQFNLSLCHDYIVCSVCLMFYNNSFYQIC